MYQYGGYSSTTPTRPYLVTTDILWEVWAAAYEGLFILREREMAIPAFWTFVDAAAEQLLKAELLKAELSKADASSPWARLFMSARASRDGATRDEEAQRIRAHAGTAPSRALGEPFDYAELTPRGHYAGKPAAADYFAAMRYLTAAGAKLKDTGPLASPTLALSHPDPMPKVADVAGGGAVPLLLAAVGAPLEFDLVVPFFGRRQVVKGAVYAYHELTSRAPMTDEEWRKRAGSEPLVKWAEPFVARTLLTCPPKSPF
jgi:hypothetical protein